MNPKTHRLVFNRARGCMMAVSESANSRGAHGGSGARRVRRRCTFTPDQAAPLPGTGFTYTPPAPTAPGQGPGVAFNWRDLGLSAPQAAAAALHGSPAIPRIDWAALAPVTGSVKADNLTLELTGTFTNIGPLVVTNALTINAAQGINNSNASIHTGTLNINSHDGFLNNTNGQINAQSFNANIAGQLDNTRGKISVLGDAYLKTGDVVANHGFFESKTGNFTLDSTGNIALNASTLSADQGLLKLKAAGNIALGFIKGPRNTSTTTERLDDPTVIRPGGCSGSGESEHCTTEQLISAGSTVKTLQTISDTFQGTELSGANIELNAGKDLTLTASELQSTGDIALSALGQVSVGAAVGTADTTHTQTRSDTQLVDVYDGGDSGSWSQHLQTTTSTQTTTGTQQFAQGSNITAQGKLTIQSGADMAIDSSALKGEQGVALLSAGDLNIGGQHLKGQSTERKPATAGQQETTTAKETQTFAGSTISSGSGSVSAVALGDVSASGSTLAAKQNINLIGDSVSVNAQVNTTESLETQGNPNGGRHWQTTDKQTQTLAGGKVEAGQDINVIAGMSAELGYQVGLLASPTSALPERPTSANSGNITLSGAQLSAGTPGSQEVGQVNLLAQGDIDIGTVEVVNTNDTFKFDKSSNFGGNSTTTQRTVTETHTQVGTSVSADQINVAAGGDLNMTGSAVSAAGDVNLAATGNVTIQAATNTETRYTEDGRRSSGITSSGGLSLHVGTSSQKSQAWLDATSQSQGMSMMGSTEGDVRIVAGKTYTQQGSDVLTPQGDIAILAKSVNIEDGRDKLHVQTKQEFKQSGLTVALGGGILDTLTATGEAIEGVTGGGSNRNKTLNALIAYGKANDLIVQGKAVDNAAKQNGVLNSEGKSDAAAASGIKVSIGVGASSSKSQSDEQYTKGTGSTIKAAGNVTVIATEGDLNVKGSRVQAKNDLALVAANNVNIVASTDTQTHRSSNESSSASVGVSFGVGAGSAGVSLDIAASKGKGQANSDSTTTQSSLVTAGQRVTIISGQDTNIRGGNVHGKQVVADVGGNLNIESLQDTSTSKADQKTTGVALSIPITGSGGGASISQSKQNSNSNYQSVGQQSGISAGEGGFQINVKNNTDLDGAVIASTASADKNSLNTGTLTTSDISNTMSASASSSGTSVGTQMLSGKYELGKAMAGNALNNGSADQNDASTTKTAISGAQVTVNGVTTDTSKEALTDSHGKFVDTDTKNSHRSLVNTDIANLQQEAQQEQADNMLAFKAVTTFTDEANRTLYKVGAQVYRVPPGCSDKSCAVLLDEEETRNLKPSQDGKVHLSNNGILNDLDGAVKYAQQHGGKSNPDGSKDYSEKPDNQYIVFAPEANIPLSELMIASVQKSGLTPYVGLTNPEAKTSELVQQTTRQDKSIVIDSHSRGTLTTDNALQSINNQGGITDGNGNTIKPNIQLNNYGGAQNNESGNKTLQQVTGNENAQLNSVVHPKDLVGKTPVLVGGNPTNQTYNNTATGSEPTKAQDDGKGFFSNLWNILFGKATPHSCYGTASKVCDPQWENIPKSNSPKITNPDYKAPVNIPQYQHIDKVTPKVGQSSNTQMNQLLQPTQSMTTPVSPKPLPNDMLETLKNFKQEQ